MAVSVTGSVSEVDGSAGDGSTTVMVPADATAAIAFWAHFDSNGGSTLATLTLAGSGFSTQAEIAEGALTDQTGTGVAILTSLPGTGSQTLAWTWSAGSTRTEGGGIFIVWVKAAGTVTPRNANLDADVGGSGVTCDVTSEPTDLVLAMAQSFGGDPAIVASTVLVDFAPINQEGYDVGVVTTGAGAATTCTLSAPNYSTIAGISLYEITAVEPEPTHKGSPRRGLMGVS